MARTRSGKTRYPKNRDGIEETGTRTSGKSSNIRPVKSKNRRKRKINISNKEAGWAAEVKRNKYLRGGVMDPSKRQREDERIMNEPSRSLVDKMFELKGLNKDRRAADKRKKESQKRLERASNAGSSLYNLFADPEEQARIAKRREYARNYAKTHKKPASGKKRVKMSEEERRKKRRDYARAYSRARYKNMTEAEKEKKRQQARQYAKIRRLSKLSPEQQRDRQERLAQRMGLTIF